MQARLLAVMLAWILPFASASSLSAQSDALEAAPGFSLVDALRAMRTQHPLLRSASFAVRAAQADKRGAKLWSNPTLAGSYTAGVRHSSYDPSGYASYGVTQALELRNAPGARGRVAELLVLASRADYDAVDLELTLDVESAFIDVAAAQRKVELIGRAVNLLDQAAHVVTQRVSAGASPRYDASRIAVTIAGVHADYASSQADLARAQAELRAAIGPGAASLRGTPSYALESEPVLPAPEALLELLVRGRPDLEAARQRAASAHASILAARRSVWPGVAVSLLGGFGAAPSQVDVGVGLSVPLPAIDHGQGAIPAAEARALQAAADAEALLVPARERVVGMRAEILARRRAFAEYGQLAFGSGDEMLTEAQAGYLAGRFSVLELADAYAAWRDARLRVIDLAADARKAELDLGREMGRSLREPEGL